MDKTVEAGHRGDPTYTVLLVEHSGRDDLTWSLCRILQQTVSLVVDRGLFLLIVQIDQFEKHTLNQCRIKISSHGLKNGFFFQLYRV